MPCLKHTVVIYGYVQINLVSRGRRPYPFCGCTLGRFSAWFSLVYNSHMRFEILHVTIDLSAQMTNNSLCTLLLWKKEENVMHQVQVLVNSTLWSLDISYLSFYPKPVVSQVYMFVNVASQKHLSAKLTLFCIDISSCPSCKQNGTRQNISTTLTFLSLQISLTPFSSAHPLCAPRENNSFM